MLSVLESGLKFTRLQSLSVCNLGLSSVNCFFNLMLSPFLQTVDFSYNPIKAASMRDLCKMLPLSAVRQLSLAFVHMSAETL